MILTALIIGFGGSMHCLGMCSPLVMAVTNVKPSALLNRILYNAGRIGMYGVMGALVSGAGMLLPLHELREVLSVALGMVLLLIGFGAVKKLEIPGLTPALHRLTRLLKKTFAGQLKQGKRGTMLVLGALNGLLPCGLTLVALTWCLTLKGPVDGFNFMLLFGAGTLPVMLGLTSALPALIKKWPLSTGKLTASMLILSGFLLIARAVMVHIPLTHPTAGRLVEVLCR